KAQPSPPRTRAARPAFARQVVFTGPCQHLPLPPQALDFVQKRQGRRRVEGGDVLDVSVNFPAGHIGAGSLECGCDASNKAIAIFCASLPAIDPPRPRRRRFCDPTQLLKALRCQVSHHVSPPHTLTRTSRNLSFA